MDAYTDLSVMMVEGIDLHVDILVSLVLPIIIAWIFRTLIHEKKQYSYVHKIFFLSKALKQTKAGPRELLF